MKKSLISAVKKLLAKLGAEEIEGNNLVEVIDNGADAIEGGGGSGGTFVVTFSGTTAAGNATSNKTWEEISAADNAGKQIIFQYGTEGAGLAVHTDNDRQNYYACMIFAANPNQEKQIFINYQPNFLHIAVIQ